MSDTNIGNTEGTEPSTETQTQAKTFTQDEVNSILARSKSQLEKKYTSKYDELGDPDELREIVTSHRKHQQDQQLKRGEFDRILQDVVSKKDLEIQKRDRLIEQFKLESPIVDAAARYRAVNPEQVKALVRNQVRLSTEGEVEVLDTRGEVRRDDNGQPVSVDFLIQDFLNNNPHFVSASPSTTAARSNHQQAGKVNLGELDLKNPAHRKLYAEQRGFRS